MISGIHALIYAEDAAKARAFFREVLGFRSVDVGHGWLIFALPPAELGVHPVDAGGKPYHELYLMCDDVQATVSKLQSKGIECGPITDAGWGVLTSVTIPGGGSIGLYQPRHETAIKMKPATAKKPVSRRAAAQKARSPKPRAKRRARRKR